MAASVLVTTSEALADAVDEELRRRVAATKHTERVEQALRTLEESDLSEMIGSGEVIRVSCEFCGTEYRFSPEELLALRSAETESEKNEN